MNTLAARREKTPYEIFDDSCRKLTKVYSSIKPETPFSKTQMILELVSRGLSPSFQDDSLYKLCLINNRNLSTPRQNSDMISQHYLWVGTSILRVRFPSYTSDAMGIELDTDLEVIPPNTQPIDLSRKLVDRYSNRLDSILEKENIKF